MVDAGVTQERLETRGLANGRGERVERRRVDPCGVTRVDAEHNPTA
jgi:hypothetical protein